LERARKTVEARIADIEAKKAQFQTKIDGYKAKIAALDTQIQELCDAQKQKDLENLLKVIKASGKTPEEVISALNANN
jgi:hypothetical protein